MQSFLMMKQTDTGKCHCYAIFITSLYNMIITYRTSCLRLCNLHHSCAHVQYCHRMEKTHQNPAQHLSMYQPRTFLLTSQNLRLFSKELLPNTIGQYIFVIITDIDINCIVAVGTSYFLHPRQIQHFRMLAQVPNIGLIARQAEYNGYGSAVRHQYRWPVPPLHNKQN